MLDMTVDVVTERESFHVYSPSGTEICVIELEDDDE